MAALKKQLESQGVNVDDKMMEIMKSLQMEGKEGQTVSSPDLRGKAPDAMAEIEAALYRDGDDGLPTWGVPIRYFIRPVGLPNNYH